MQTRIGRSFLLTSILFVGLLFLPVRSEAGFVDTLQLEPEYKVANALRTEVVKSTPAQQGTSSIDKQSESLKIIESDPSKKPTA